MPKGIKVFGIGLNKTGTSTLKVACRRMGFNHLKFRPFLVQAFRRGDMISIWEAADSHESFDDWPWPLMYREIHQRYGESARFVLTRRTDPDVWVESLKRHSERINPQRNMRRMVYGHDYPHGLEEVHKQIYLQHNADVRQYFRDQDAEELLAEFCWEDGDGWEDLCAFLSEPLRTGRFPHANSGNTPKLPSEFEEENQRRISAQLSALRKS